MTEIPENNADNTRTEEFLKLLIANQHNIRAYIGILVPNYNDADDIMQDTTATMWRKFNEFEPGTNFGAWGARIAYLNTKHYYRKKSKYAIWTNARLFEQFEQFAEIIVKNNDVREERLIALRECSKKLGSNEQRLLHLRYGLSKTVKDIAASTGKTSKYFYRALARIHNQLLKCIRRRLIEAGVL